MTRKGAGYPDNFQSEQLEREGMQANTSLSVMLEPVTLANAALLARKGKLKQAETLLLPLVNRPPSKTNTLDLLAKVYAQQNKILEAQSIWLRAVQIDPNNKHFLRALMRCAGSANE